MGLFDIFRASKIKAENELLKARLAELGCDEYEQVKEKIRQMEAEHSNNVKAVNFNE